MLYLLKREGKEENRTGKKREKRRKKYARSTVSRTRTGPGSRDAEV
jgi:hypothetical protein